MIDPDQDSIERLKRKLYGRVNTIPPVRRSALGERDAALPHDWQGPENNMSKSKLLKPGFLKRMLIGVAVLFLILLGATIFIFYRGNNTVSSENVAIEIRGPVSVRSGENVNLDVAVTNNNPTAMEFVDLVIEYPPGTRSDTDLNKLLTRDRRNLATIKPGETVKQTIKAVLFGDKDANLPVKVSTEYRLANSNAIFSTDKTYLVSINSSPIDVTLDVPDQVNTNQELALKVTISSNTQTDIKLPLVVITYPSGFEFKQASLPPTYQKNVWQLDRLSPGGKVVITVKGVLVGQDEEQKAFRVDVGSGATENDTAIALNYGSITKVLTIQRMSVGLSTSMNGTTGAEYVASNRERIDLEIKWSNNLPTPVTDGELLVTLNGAVLDQASVGGSRGSYRSSTGVISWNKANMEGLSSVAPGSSNSVRFYFQPISLISANNYQIKNPAIDLKIVFKAKRVSEDGGTEPIESTLSRTVKINSVLQVVAKALYASGPLENSGPLPPKVDQETTYTITWSLVNSSSDTKETVVRATVPPSIKFIGNTLPTNENLTFNSVDGGGGEVVWNLGLVRGGTGLATSPREVSFQVGLTPSLNQVGSTPVLLEIPSFSAIDSFTGKVINETLKNPLDTNLKADPQFKPGQEAVVK
jgi:hypothetical protein